MNVLFQVEENASSKLFHLEPLAQCPAKIRATKAVDFGWRISCDGYRDNRRLCHAAAPASSAGDATGSSDGFVRTSQGAALPGAMVRLTNTETNQAWVSWTDSTGKFEFPLLPAGHYRIDASQIGFQPATIETQLPAAPSNPVAVVLRVATLAELTAPAGGGSGTPGRSRGLGFGGRGGGFAG